MSLLLACCIIPQAAPLEGCGSAAWCRPPGCPANRTGRTACFRAMVPACGSPAAGGRQAVLPGLRRVRARHGALRALAPCWYRRVLTVAVFNGPCRGRGLIWKTRVVKYARCEILMAAARCGIPRGRVRRMRRERGRGQGGKDKACRERKAEAGILEQDRRRVRGTGEAPLRGVAPAGRSLPERR